MSIILWEGETMSNIGNPTDGAQTLVVVLEWGGMTEDLDVMRWARVMKNWWCSPLPW